MTGVYRFPIILRVEINQPGGGVDDCRARGKPLRRFDFFIRFVVLACRRKHQREPVERARILRIKLDGAAVIRFGGNQISLVIE